MSMTIMENIIKIFEDNKEIKEMSYYTISTISNKDIRLKDEEYITEKSIDLYEELLENIEMQRKYY